MNELSTPMPSPETSTQMNSLAITYVGFWTRFVAYLIDMVILNIFNFIGFLIAGIIGASVVAELGLIIMLLILLALVLYEPYFISSESQATPGKQALGIKVVNHQGNRISFGTAILRLIGKYIGALILLLGFIIIGFHSRKQGLHDMIANTYVVPK